MAAGVHFWRYPDQEVEFLDFLESTGTIIAVLAGGAQSPSAFEPRPFREFLLSVQPHILHLGLMDLAHSIEVEEKGSEGARWFGLDYMKPCLLTYERGNLLPGGRLTYSSLYAHWTYLDPARRVMVKKDPQFKKWAEKVFRWVRKWTPEYHESKSYRLTTKVKQALNNGKVTLEM